ncbi:sugar ABC transporter substrate-binding protein [Microbacterium album]|uniref:Periplasmic binding protein domain-containing protein n=1 Tax=Microbacterium album TaxID=2053191 RepID=A0A917IAS9_9MICO|nr:substrate-binding domain-containing protein [Microbacterium album]GGH33441.1 hypothetical protein GCM10010921_00370 [Microbacterium album]
MINARSAGSLAGLAIAALMLAACGGATQPGDQTGSGGDDELSEAAAAALELAYEGYGSTLEDLAPTTPPEGIDFFVMSCGEQLPTCAGPSASMVEAAQAAGWNATIVDGKLNPEGFATAIRQAVAAGADVLVPIGVSCSSAAAAFAEAAEAGVTIVGGGGVDDCDPKRWGSERKWLPDRSASEIFQTIGEVQADYVFGKNNGDVNALVLNSTSNAWGAWITEAFQARLEELGGGEVHVLDISDPETANNSYLQKVTSALLSNPEINAVTMSTDSYLVTGLAAAIDQAGFGDQAVVVGAFGSEAAIDMIREGQPGITATVGIAQNWEAWGSIDTAIRVLNGEEPAFIGQSLQVVDADNNLPDSGPYNGSIDWQSKFLEAWGKQ